MKMKFKKIEDGVPHTDRDVQVLLKDKSMSIGYYVGDEFVPANVDVDSYCNVIFIERIIAWAELPEVEYE